VPNDTARERYLRDVDVAARYAVTRQCVWKWARCGVIPAPVSLTPGCTRWALSRLEQFEADRTRDARTVG